MTRRWAESLALATGLALGAGCSETEPEAPTAGRDDRLNVLWIIVDDLRATTAAYGEPEVHAPAIDRLASSGVTFLSTYAQQALCAPSRASFLTGLRPEASGVLDLVTDYRAVHPDVVTLPQLFRDAGYRTLALGKVHHGRGQLDDELSWSEPPWRPEGWQGYQGTPARRAKIAELKERAELLGQRFDASRVYSTDRAPDDEELPDQQTAARARELLREVADEPFFLAVGFLKPHLPYVAPERFWDLYPPREVGRRALPPEPAGAASWAIAENEAAGYVDVGKDGRIDELEALELRRGYLACVSYVDELIGDVLDELDRLGLADETIVVLSGDNGWHMGEHDHWGKDTNFDLDTRVPLIVRAPGTAGGSTTRALTELVDVYPTLVELAGLELPEHVEGTSFAPLLEEPDRPWKSAAFCVTRRDGPDASDVPNDILGRSIRTATHRLVDWNDGEVIELYAYDEGGVELEQIAERPAEAARVAELRARLAEGWTGARP